MRLCGSTIRSTVLATHALRWHSIGMHTEDSKDQTGTAEHIAKRVQSLESLASTLNQWALNHQDKIPRPAKLRLNPLLGHIPGELMGLRASLRNYDAALAAALDRTETE